jgi:hypothetical protein
MHLTQTTHLELCHIQYQGYRNILYYHIEFLDIFYTILNLLGVKFLTAISTTQYQSKNLQPAIAVRCPYQQESILKHL